MSATNKGMSSSNAWNVFENWYKEEYTRSMTLSWDAFDELLGHHNRIIENKYESLLPLLE